jgi:hypothetical protein
MTVQATSSAKFRWQNRGLCEGSLDVSFLRR